MKSETKLKNVRPNRGKLKYNIGTWVDYQTKKRAEHLAMMNGHTLASFFRFLVLREIDDFREVTDNSSN